MASPIHSSCERDGGGDTAGRLLEAARQGHDDAFGQLFESFRRHLLLLAHREMPLTLRGKVGPSDLVQETAVDARRNIPGFRGSTAEECYAWLRAILRNNMIERSASPRRRAAARAA